MPSVRGCQWNTFAAQLPCLLSANNGHLTLPKGAASGHEASRKHEFVAGLVA